MAKAVEKCPNGFGHIQQKCFGHFQGHLKIARKTPDLGHFLGYGTIPKTFYASGKLRAALRRCTSLYPYVLCTSLKTTTTRCEIPARSLITHHHQLKEHYVQLSLLEAWIYLKTMMKCLVWLLLLCNLHKSSPLGLLLPPPSSSLRRCCCCTVLLLSFVAGGSSKNKRRASLINFSPTPTIHCFLFMARTIQILPIQSWKELRASSIALESSVKRNMW